MYIKTRDYMLYVIYVKINIVRFKEDNFYNFYNTNT